MVIVVQLNGPLWAIDGRPLEVPASAKTPWFITEDLYKRHAVVEPRTVEIRQADLAPFTITLAPDGAVTTSELSDFRILEWLRPAPEQRSTFAPAPAAPEADNEPEWAVFGVHPGAGASTWTELLNARELTDPSNETGRLLLVARTTLRGVEEAKSYTHRAGAVLMVADAPGRFPADVRRGLRVLSGAAPVVPVPWLPPLRGTLTVSHTQAVAKASAKIAAAIRSNWKDTP